MNITWIGSPNYTAGRNGRKIDGFIIHWMVGNLASTDTTFQNVIRNTSAGYGVENEEVHQYVRDGDTAYQAGNWDVNLSTIGIEHSAGPGRNASDATYETSAQLIALKIKEHGINNYLRGHNAIVATQCPGTIDVARIANRVNEIIGGQVIVPAPPLPPSPPQPNLGKATVVVDALNVRRQPTSQSPIAINPSIPNGMLSRGQQADIVEAVKGELVRGVGTWLRTINNNYIWAGGTDYPTTPTVVSEGGWVTVTAPGLNVRSGPGTEYPAGQANTPNGSLDNGVEVEYVAAVYGEDVRGNPIWLRSVHGNYFWSGGTNYTK